MLLEHSGTAGVQCFAVQPLDVLISVGLWDMQRRRRTHHSSHSTPFRGLYGQLNQVLVGIVGPGRLGVACADSCKSMKRVCWAVF